MSHENERLLDHALTRTARRVPDRRFLVDSARTVTYGEAEQEVQQIAAALRRDGLQRGDRVLICCANRVEVPLAALGVLRADGVFVLVHPSTKAPKLAHLLEDSGARAVLGDRSSGAALGAALLGRESPRLRYALDGAAMPGAIHWEEALALPGLDGQRQAIDLDLATLIYTSGSTGLPKGVMLRHANLVHTSWSIGTYLQAAEDDVILDALPLSFDYGLYQVLVAMRVGATVLIERSFAFPYPLLQRMQAEGVTVLPGVPTLFALLLSLDDPGAVPLPALRTLTNTADALPPEHIARLRALYPQARLHSMYGQTECTRVCTLDPAELDRRPRSVGRAIPNTEVWLEHEDGSRCGANEQGILHVRGAHVGAGYWNAPDASARTFRPGPLPGELVLRTGDLFTTDDEGFLTFVGRSDQVIKSRGEKVSPREVEDALVGHPGVIEVAVVGEPDPLLGAAVVAHVAVRAGAGVTVAELLARAKARLEDHAVPKRVVLHQGALPEPRRASWTGRG